MRAIILYVSVPYLKHVRTLSTNNPKVNCNDQKAKVTSRLMSSDETLLLATNPSSKESTFGHLEQHPRNLLPIDPLLSEHFQSTAKNMKKRSTAQFSDQSLCFRCLLHSPKSKFLLPFHLMVPHQLILAKTWGILGYPNVPRGTTQTREVRQPCRTCQNTMGTRFAGTFSE